MNREIPSKLGGLLKVTLTVPDTNTQNDKNTRQMDLVEVTKPNL